MGRKISEDLFILIKSLRGSEKRYFKIFSKRHTIGKSNNYISLFDAVDAQKKYDEEKLLRENKFLDPKLFPDQKNHLYRQILRSLVVYSNERTADSRLRSLLESFDILNNKGLHSQCRKIIGKAKEIASGLEKTAAYIECLEKEKKLELLTFNLKTSPRKIQQINKEMDSALAQAKHDLQYSELSEEMFFILAEESFVRSEKNKKRSKKILENPLMKKAPSDGSFISRFNFHRTHSLYCYSHADFKGFYLHCVKIAQMIESSHGIMTETPNTYIVALQNLLIAQKNLMLFDELFLTLNKLKKFETETPETKARVFAISHDIELTLYIDLGQFEKGTLLANAISKGISQFKGYISNSYEILFYFNLAYNFIGCGKYRESLRWLNKAINHPQALFSLPGIYQSANLVSLLVYYQLGHFDLLEYKIRSISKDLNKKNALYDLESSLLTFFSKAIVTSTQKELKALKERLKNELEELHSNPAKRLAFGSFDFLAWAESLAAGKTMGEIIRRRI